MCTGKLIPGVKRLEREDSPSSIAEVKDAWSYTSTPPVHLHGVVFFKKLIYLNGVVFHSAQG
jgi:hypothetical protein